jgi:hypothetical protein
LQEVIMRMPVELTLISVLLGVGVGTAAAAQSEARKPPALVGDPESYERLPVAKEFTWTLGDGCRVTLVVRGALFYRPARDASAQRYHPDLAFETALACPSAPVLTVTDELTGPQALAEGDLAGAMVRRTTLVTQAGGRRCALVPDLRFDGQTLSEAGVSYLCPAPTRTELFGAPPRSLAPAAPPARLRETWPPALDEPEQPSDQPSGGSRF